MTRIEPTEPNPLKRAEEGEKTRPEGIPSTNQDFKKYIKNQQDKIGRDKKQRSRDEGAPPLSSPYNASDKSSDLVKAKNEERFSKDDLLDKLESTLAEGKFEDFDLINSKIARKPVYLELTPEQAKMIQSLNADSLGRVQTSDPKKVQELKDILNKSVVKQVKLKKEDLPPTLGSIGEQLKTSLEGQESLSNLASKLPSKSQSKPIYIELSPEQAKLLQSLNVADVGKNQAASQNRKELEKLLQKFDTSPRAPQPPLTEANKPTTQPTSNKVSGEVPSETRNVNVKRPAEDSKTFQQEFATSKTQAQTGRLENKEFKLSPLETAAESTNKGPEIAERKKPSNGGTKPSDAPSSPSFSSKKDIPLSNTTQPTGGGTVTNNPIKNQAAQSSSIENRQTEGQTSPITTGLRESRENNQPIPINSEVKGTPSLKEVGQTRASETPLGERKLGEYQADKIRTRPTESRKIEGKTTENSPYERAEVQGRFAEVRSSGNIESKQKAPEGQLSDVFNRKNAEGTPVNTSTQTPSNTTDQTSISKSIQTPANASESTPPTGTNTQSVRADSSVEGLDVLSELKTSPKGAKPAEVRKQAEAETTQKVESTETSKKEVKTVQGISQERHTNAPGSKQTTEELLNERQAAQRIDGSQKPADKANKDTASPEAEAVAAAANAITQPAPLETAIKSDQTDVRQISREEMAQLIDELVKGITVSKAQGQTETVVVLRAPQFLEGASVTIVTYDQAKGEANIVFSNLTPEAKRILDDRLSRDSLASNLKDRTDITVHNIITTTQDQPQIFTQTERPKRDDSEGRSGGQGQQQQQDDQGQ